jgi:hypothetical protein
MDIIQDLKGYIVRQPEPAKDEIVKFGRSHDGSKYEE